MSKFTRYANVTEQDKQDVIAKYRDVRSWTTAGHAAAIAAHDAFELTHRQWSGKTGADAFAAALAILVMAEEIKLS